MRTVAQAYETLRASAQPPATIGDFEDALGIDGAEGIAVCRVLRRMFADLRYEATGPREAEFIFAFIWGVAIGQAMMGEDEP